MSFNSSGILIYRTPGLDSSMNGHYLKSIKEVVMIALEVTKEELSLLKMLLNREEVSTRIEIHHARMSFEYRDYLKAREKEIGELLERIKQHLPDEH